MFTGIIETLGEVIAITPQGSNIDISIRSNIASELKIDQSVAHNGVCLTVVNVENDSYSITAIDETLSRSNLGALEVGALVNLERCVQMNGRLDGHIVQGHVDQTATVHSINEVDGSWIFRFEYDEALGNITVEKGSICVNGVSLTVVNSEDGYFSVAVIPYTFENTNFHQLQMGSTVNLEFDIIGKYVAKLVR